MIRLLREKYRQVPAYLYLFFMCSLFLFYWDNYYFNITVTRYRFFRYASIALIIAYVAVALIEAVIKVKAHENIKEWIKNTVEHFWQSLNIVDLSLLLFLLVSYVSYYINSEYRYEIWEGNAGRYMGVEVYTLLVCAYFLISRHVYKVKPVILCFSAAVCVISILTVLNFFMIDPLGFTINLKESSERIFLSTIGNINFLSSLLCIAYPITGFLYIACEHQKERIYYLLCSVLSFIAVVLASSDSGFWDAGFSCLFVM